MALLSFGKSRQGQSGLGNIPDVTACKTWLAGLARTGTDDAMVSIGDFLRDFPQEELAPAMRVQILDQCRATVYAALSERVDHDQFRALPLSMPEIEPIWAVVDTVIALRDAYSQLSGRLASANAPDSTPGLSPAGVLHRALDLNAHLIVLYLGTRVAVPLADWEEHCRMGQLVRELDAQDQPQPDPLNAIYTQTCREAFVAPLLLALTDPSSVTQLEYQVLSGCARRFANKAGYRIDPAANPAARAAARPVINPGPTLTLGAYLIRFDCQRLFGSLESRIQALDQGKTPAFIGFGSRASVAVSRTLLQRMMRLWGAVVVDTIEAPEHRWRTPANEQTWASLGMPAMDQSSGKRASAIPVSGTYRYERDRHDGLTRSQTEIEAARLAELLQQGENWQLVGEVADTLLFMRRHPRPRVSMNQLVVVRPGGKDSSTPVLLGYVQGVQQGIQEDAEGRTRPSAAHNLRVKLLPGVPVRIGAGSEGAEIPGVFLMADAAIGAHPNLATVALWERVRADTPAFSLVLPLACYRPQRRLRAVAGGVVINLQCEDLIFRGLDFDQVRFTIV